MDVLDSAPEAEFDALVQAAALVCGVPISLISLIDADRQWFKANVGLPGVCETPRQVAFCAHAILQDGIFQVADATADPRFANNTLVTGEPGIRFYAGATLRLSDGARVGTLCVIDRQPRQLDASQCAVLAHLAAAASQALEGRRALRAERALRDAAAQSAAALADSESRYRALGEASPLGVFSTDEQGACAYTNAQWQAIHGLTHPDDRASVWAQWQGAVAQGSDFDLQFRILRADGQTRFVRCRARARIEAQAVVGFVGSVVDVTERQLAEMALREERQRLASIIEGTGAGTWEWNVQTGETRFNQRWAAIIGHTLDELAPISIQTWTDRAHPGDLQRSNDLLRKHFAGELPHYDCEARMRHRDGHWVWVLDRGRVLSWTADGQPEWMFGTHLDITDRRRQEDELRKSEALLARSGEVAGVGGWELDLLTGALSWSAQTRRIHGVPDDFVPQLSTAIDFYVPEARPVIQAAVEQAIATGEVYDLELPLIHASGRQIWVRAVGSADFEEGRAVRLMGAFQDITERHRLSAELAEQHELLRVTLQSIGDAVITTDAEGRVAWLNPVAERMTGWPTAEAKGRPVGVVFNIIHEETRLPADSPIAACLLQGTVTGLANQTVLVSRAGEEFGIEDSAAPIRNQRGELLGVVLVFHDVTEQRRMSGEMSYRATHDELTGLVNRSEFEARLRRLLNKSHEDRSEHALLYIDLDQFKLVNDACGHSIGDQLLQKVSQLLGDVVRTRDTLARLGGDEFAVILEHCPVDQAQRVAQKICAHMDDFRFVHDQHRFRIGASIGLVPVDRRWGTAAAVMQAADTSCYAAKEAGRNRVHLWFDTDQAMRARHGEMQWAARLEQALDENRFVLYGQRIQALGAGAHGLHVEALVRMLDSEGAMVSPAAFLPAAERFHLASRIDRWVLRHAIDRLKALADLSAVETLCINLSGQSIGDRVFHRHALETLQLSGSAICRRLCLEITETATVTHIADARVFIDQVRALGVRIALDDFGSGASSFGYLKNLSVDMLKIDGQFIRDIVDDPLDDAAVRCFVDVARVVGVKTVAEFVGRAEVLDRVRDIGVDFAQGFLIHHPEPLDRVLGLKTHEPVALLAQVG
jgi:diguanylate cyclase